MPELPEVETVCRDLRRSGVLGLPIRSIDIGWERSLGGMGTRLFTGLLLGRTFIDIRRRGKFLVLETDDRQTMLIHLRMSGSLSVESLPYLADVHDRITFFFPDRVMRFHDPRKFGRIILTRQPDEVLGNLGPEPLDPMFGEEAFHAMLLARRGRLKALLLDQSFIAGIGNIYADESLFVARLHPNRSALSLDRTESARLLQAIRKTLSAGIAHRGTSLGDGEGNFTSAGESGHHGSDILVFRKTGMPCPRCGTPIERIKVTQRSTHFCPACQPM